MINFQDGTIVAAEWHKSTTRQNLKYSTIPRSKQQKCLRISTVNLLDGIKRSQQVFICDITDIMYFGCIYLIFDGVSINLALLRQYRTLNLCSSIVKYSQITKTIESNLSLKTTRQILKTDSKYQNNTCVISGGYSISDSSNNRSPCRD